MKTYDNDNPLYPALKENHTANTLMAICSIVVAIIAIAFIINHFSFYSNPSVSSVPVAESYNTEDTTENPSSDTDNEVYNNTEPSDSTDNFSEQTQPSFSVEKADSSQTDTDSQNIYYNSVSGDYVIPDSSTSYLTESDLYGLSKEQLSIARNEIYARNGRLFQDQDLQNYFNSKSWYHGFVAPEDFTLDMLNNYEYDNINLIASYEESLGYR